MKLINLIISSYEKFFSNLEAYNYKNYKKEAETIALG